MHVRQEASHKTYESGKFSATGVSLALCRHLSCTDVPNHTVRKSNQPEEACGNVLR